MIDVYILTTYINQNIVITQLKLDAIYMSILEKRFYRMTGYTVYVLPTLKYCEGGGTEDYTKMAGKTPVF